MITTLLVITFLVDFAVVSIVVFVFHKPVESTLNQVVPAELSCA